MKKFLLICAVAWATVGFGYSLTPAECQKKAREGDAIALYELGARYEAGDGVQRSILKALSNYKKAAEKGNEAACKRLAVLYAEGKVVGKNPQLAAKYRSMAGDEMSGLGRDEDDSSEDVDAQLKEARDVLMGRNGKRKDVNQGVLMLFELAKKSERAQRKFMDAIEEGLLDLSLFSSDEIMQMEKFFLALYDKGNKFFGGVLGIYAYNRKDYEAAIKYWDAGSSAGNRYSSSVLGSFYSGHGDFKAPKEMQSNKNAIKYFERYISQGGDKNGVIELLGCLYLIEGMHKKAYGIFSDLYENDKGNVEKMYFCGLAGYWLTHSKQRDVIDASCKMLFPAKAESHYGPQMRRKKIEAVKQWEKAMKSFLRDVKPHCELIDAAARNGFETAKEFKGKRPLIFRYAAAGISRFEREINALHNQSGGINKIIGAGIDATNNLRELEFIASLSREWYR